MKYLQCCNNQLYRARSGWALILIIFLIALTGCAAKTDRIRNSFKEYNGRYVIFVNKKNFTLEVFDRSLEVVASYKIGYGENPDKKPKLHDGDNRTPEGEYVINEILSMDADHDSPQYKTLSRMNQVYFRAREGHHKYGMPDVDLGDNAYGPRFFGINYPNRMDVKRYEDALKRGDIPRKKGGQLPIGKGLAIHGNCDEISIGTLCSSGCIRMFNTDIIEMDQYVQIGTPVIIE